MVLFVTVVQGESVARSKIVKVTEAVVIKIIGSTNFHTFLWTSKGIRYVLLVIRFLKNY